MCSVGKDMTVRGLYEDSKVYRALRATLARFKVTQLPLSFRAAGPRPARGEVKNMASTMRLRPELLREDGAPGRPAYVDDLPGHPG